VGAANTCSCFWGALWPAVGGCSMPRTMRPSACLQTAVRTVQCSVCTVDCGLCIGHCALCIGHWAAPRDCGPRAALCRVGPSANGHSRRPQIINWPRHGASVSLWQSGQWCVASSGLLVKWKTSSKWASNWPAGARQHIAHVAFGRRWTQTGGRLLFGVPVEVAV